MPWPFAEDFNRSKVALVEILVRIMPPRQNTSNVVMDRAMATLRGDTQPFSSLVREIRELIEERIARNPSLTGFTPDVQWELGTTDSPKADRPKWSKAWPTAPGFYWARGWFWTVKHGPESGIERQTALIQVIAPPESGDIDPDDWGEDGVLRCFAGAAGLNKPGFAEQPYRYIETSHTFHSFEHQSVEWLPAQLPGEDTK